MNIHVDDNNEVILTTQSTENVDVMAGDTINIASSNYEALQNKPQIGGVELVGNVSLDDIGAASEADIPVVPTNISAFNNDSGYITGYTETDPTVPNWAKAPLKPSYTASEVGALPDSTVIPTVPTKVSAFSNDAGYITGYTETDPTVPQWAKAQNKPSYTAQEVGALPENTSIPSKTSDLDNDSDFTTKTYVDEADDDIRGKVFYGIVDGTSTNTAFTATIPGITEYVDGLAVMLKNGVVTSASGFTININGLGAKQAYNNMAAASAETTMFNVNYTL